MKTLFAACLRRLGLTQDGAVRLLGTRPDTVLSWSTGRNPVPAGIWDKLRAYEAVIVDRSEAIREAWEDAGETNDITARADDREGLMALADFVLSRDLGARVRVELVREPR